jgi:hypothetical protein
MTVTKEEVIEQLICDILHQSFKHEVQTWKDAPGTDAERMAEITKLARTALAVVRDKLKPEDA